MKKPRQFHSNEKDTNRRPIKRSSEGIAVYGLKLKRYRGIKNNDRSSFFRTKVYSGKVFRRRTSNLCHLRSETFDVSLNKKKKKKYQNERDGE